MTCLSILRFKVQTKIVLEVPIIGTFLLFQRGNRLVAHGVSSSKSSGLCPHGFPNGACPLCSGMGGGGSARTRNMRRNPGEMTYNECYAIWQMMKAAKLQNDRLEKQQQAAQIENAQKLNNMNTDIASKNIFLRMFSSNFVKDGITTINNFVKNIAKIATNITNFVVQGFNTIVNSVKNFITDISGKIALFFGEEKQAIEDNIKKAVKAIKEKFISLFGFINKSNREEETEEIVKKEEKKIISLKQIRQKLKLLKENQKDDNKQHSTQHKHT